MISFVFRVPGFKVSKFQVTEFQVSELFETYFLKYIFKFMKIDI